MQLKIYCINLKERPDRWERFQKQPGFQRLLQLFPFERFEGVNGKLLDIQKDARVSIRTKRNILYQKRRDHEDLDTAGGVGCYLSHKGVWDSFLSSGSQAALIFEDDALIPLDFADKLQGALADLQAFGERRPGIWLLSRPSWGPTLAKAMEFDPIRYQGNWATGVAGPLTGYILFPEAAEILSKNALPIDGHVDHFMHRCAQLGLLEIAHHKKIILYQIAVKKRDSDIQEAGSCEICNLPSQPNKKGYYILTNQQASVFLVSLVTMTGLFYLVKKK
jgi:GR25 family glycosyltransferase involved in LPS biosynthesis